MFQNAALDVAIGLTLMYGTLSLLCTVVNEWIATQLDLRAKNLAAGLQELLDDPKVRADFYAHGLIAGTKKALASGGRACRTWRAMAADPEPGAAPSAQPGAAPPKSVDTKAPAEPPRASSSASLVTSTPSNGHPSYLSAETFSLALIAVITGAPAPGQPTPDLEQLLATIAKLPPSHIKSVLQASVMSAEGSFNNFRKSVTTWFDDSMDRLSGAYKRHLKVISIVVGCAVAAAMNVDTFAVGHSLWSDGGLRAEIVQAADAAAKKGTSSEASSTVSNLGNAYKEADETLRPLPIGWPLRDCPGAEWTGAYVWFLTVKVFGLMVTGLALSLGAPFWFDLLSKFINIRGAGIKPDRQDAKDATGSA